MSLRKWIWSVGPWGTKGLLGTEGITGPEDGNWGAWGSDYRQFEVIGSDLIQEMTTAVSASGSGSQAHWKRTMGIFESRVLEGINRMKGRGFRENGSEPVVKILQAGKGLTQAFATKQAMDGVFWWWEIDCELGFQGRGEGVWSGSSRGSRGPLLTDAHGQPGRDGSQRPWFPLAVKCDWLLGYCCWWLLNKT